MCHGHPLAFTVLTCGLALWLGDWSQSRRISSIHRRTYTISETRTTALSCVYPDYSMAELQKPFWDLFLISYLQTGPGTPSWEGNG